MAKATDAPVADDQSQEFWSEADFLAEAARDVLEFFQAMGVAEIPRENMPTLENISRAASPPASGRAPRKSAPAANQVERQPEPTKDFVSQAAGLAELERAAADCQLCPLAESRRRVVFGEGSANPKIVVVNGWPDEAAEAAGRTAGPIGGLLEAILEKGLTLAPDEVYICPAVKCRPSDDGPPPPAAMAACRRIMTRQLEFLKPKMVLAFGETAARSLSGSKSGLGFLRPKTLEVQGFPGLYLRSTYALQDILAEPALKKQAWQDLRPILKFLKGV